MTRVLFVGQDPETVDYTDPALPPGLNAGKIHAGIDVAAAKIAERGWIADLCMIAPDEAGMSRLKKHLADTYDCVVIGAGMRLPPKGLVMFEKVLNAVRQAAPGSPIAFNTQPEDTAEAAGRWLNSHRDG